MQEALDARPRGGRTLNRAAVVTVCALLALACGEDAKKAEITEENPDSTTTHECTEHSDCIELHGAHWICRGDRKCVNLLSTECTQVRGDDTSDDAIIVGALANEGTPLFGAADLARSDFENAVGGLPVAGSAKARPFVLVGCQYPVGGDPIPAARYLVETIGVSAIVGGQGSQPTIEIAKNITVPAGTLLISAIAQADLITSLDDNDLVFRTSPTTKALAPMLANMVSTMEATARMTRALDRVKVAVVWPRDAFGLSLSDATRSLLRFNGGKSIEQNEANGDYLEVSYDAMSPDFQLEPAQRVRDFGATIVLSLSPAEQRVFQTIEEIWPGDDGPLHLIAGGYAPETGKFVGTRADSLRQRVRFAFALDPSRPLYESYLARVEREFGPSLALVTTPATYDATYVVAFGVIAAEGKKPSGAAIARGIRRLVGPGKVVEAIPGRIAAGVEDLLMGKNIDLDGTSGALDFDEHGDVVTDNAVYCLVRDKPGAPLSLIFSGQTFRAKTGTFEGTTSLCD